MLMQLHHQFKDKTEMQAQKDISDIPKMTNWVAEIKSTHPLPDGAIWMACNEKSEHFVMTHKESP